MRVYVDESIHERGGFIVIAAVVSVEPIQSIMDEALLACGFVPGQDEFKSCMKMQGNDAAQLLRSRVREILNSQCKVAIAVCATTERPDIMSYAGRLVSQIAGSEGFESGVVYFDGGMRRSSLELPLGWKSECDCDSRVMAGIQLADGAAHNVAMMILGELGLFNKAVAVSDFYPDDEGEMPVAWELWASTRYALSSGVPVSGYDEEGSCEPLMKPFGLLVSDKCSGDVKSAVERRLSSVWVGCIH